jgi:hypothetical protein
LNTRTLTSDLQGFAEAIPNRLVDVTGMNSRLRRQIGPNLSLIPDVMTQRVHKIESQQLGLGNERKARDGEEQKTGMTDFCLFLF